MKPKMAAHMESLSDTMKLPSDIIAGAPIISMIGRRQLSVENYKGIIEYTGELVRIQTKSGRVHIKGKNLNIEYYNEDDMRITGYISTIEFLE